MSVGIEPRTHDRMCQENGKYVAIRGSMYGNQQVQSNQKRGSAMPRLFNVMNSQLPFSVS
jgi:hypothetical protein